MSTNEERCDNCANYKPTEPVYHDGIEGYRSQGEPYDVELTRDGAKVTARVFDMPESVRRVRGKHVANVLITDAEYTIFSNHKPFIIPNKMLYLRGYGRTHDNRTALGTFPTVAAAREYFAHITALLDKLNAEYIRKVDAQRVKGMVEELDRAITRREQQITLNEHRYYFGLVVKDIKEKLLTALGLEDV